MYTYIFPKLDLKQMRLGMATVRLLGAEEE